MAPTGAQGDTTKGSFIEKGFKRNFREISSKLECWRPQGEELQSGPEGERFNKRRHGKIRIYCNHFLYIPLQ